MTDPLEPCPFCGVKLVAMSDHHGSWFGHPWNGCHEDVVQIHDKKDAERWNRRVHSASNGFQGVVVPMSQFDAALREGAAILLQVAEMEEHNDAIFKGKWKKGSKAWSGAFIQRLRRQGMAKVREAAAARKEG